MIDEDAPRDDLPTPAIMQLEVVNHNDFTIADFFDGVPIVFPPEKVVTITPDVALHCFGFPGEAQDMAVHMARRFGWSGREYLKPEGLGTGDPLYVQLAAKIEIRPVYFELVRRDRNAPIPADDGADQDDAREPTGDGPDPPTRVGKRKRTTPAKFGGTRPRAVVNARAGRASRSR